MAAQVFLDCDLTLAGIEGIDELARMVGRVDEVERLTEAAMAGDVPIDEVYPRRMEIVRPDRGMLERLSAMYARRVVAGAREAVSRLSEDGYGVWIVSGGLAQAIEPFAAGLGVSAERVNAVGVGLADDGGYLGYERDNPLSRRTGKAEVCLALCPKGEVGVMVGDGASDAQAKEGGMLYVHFGGFCDRPSLRAAADAVIGEPSLAGLPEVVGSLVSAAGS